MVVRKTLEEMKSRGDDVVTAALPFETLIVAHGDVVRQNARERFVDAIRVLLARAEVRIVDDDALGAGSQGRRIMKTSLVFSLAPRINRQRLLY